MKQWYEWIRNAALDRIDDIERDLKSHSSEHPILAEAAQRLDESLLSSDAPYSERDDLWIAYSAALALEMYLAGARDGGRVYHALVTSELPIKGDKE